MKKKLDTIVTYTYEVNTNTAVEVYDTYLEYLTAIGFYTQSGITCNGSITETIEIYEDGLLIMLNENVKYKVYEGKNNDN